MIDEGYIKFHLQRTVGPAPDFSGVADLVAMRNRLRELGWIGVYTDSGIGFGNVSIRVPDGFVISGSATGQIEVADASHFTLVTDYSIDLNSVVCVGPVDASSESLTHAMVYACSPDIGAVIHIHHLDWWEDLLYVVPTSDEEVPYGTPEMAQEVKSLYESGPLRRNRILAMGGHREGILTFGKDLADAWGVLMEFR